MAIDDAGSEGLHLIGGGGMRGTPVSPDVVGAKAHGLMRLDALGLPVPPAFVLGTAHSRGVLAARDPPLALLSAGIRQLEGATGRIFGGARRPLLVAVRSGAPVSMPGMMDTVLDVGMNAETVRGLVRATGNARLAWDCQRRLVHSFAATVEGLPPEPFERLVRRRLDSEGASRPCQLDAPALRDLARDSLDLFRDLSGRSFPQDPLEQLQAAVRAVFRSWDSPRAAAYRTLKGIPGEAGTAAMVQAMVFGNAGPTSGAGVGFTRNPVTGGDELYLDFLFDAQGEDLVSGREAARDATRLAAVLPHVAEELGRVRAVLETAFRDLQEFEFTVEDGRLYLLQTRAGKRTPWAAARVAVDLVREGLIDVPTALASLEGIAIDRLERVRLVAGPAQAPLATATPAGMGVAVGAIALDASVAWSRAAAGEPVVLVRREISTEDLPGLAVADGIVTTTGGRTSHAAVVARELGKACLVDCRGLRIDLETRRCAFESRTLAEGETVSLDGESGLVFAGRLPVEREKPVEMLELLQRWRQGRSGPAVLGSRPRPVRV
jgi:pyruvate,orthophosphate dikinase